MVTNVYFINAPGRVLFNHFLNIATLQTMKHVTRNITFDNYAIKRQCVLPIDSEIIGLSGCGVIFIVSTMLLIGLKVFSAIFETGTFQLRLTLFAFVDIVR